LEEEMNQPGASSGQRKTEILLRNSHREPVPSSKPPKKDAGRTAWAVVKGHARLRRRRIAALDNLGASAPAQAKLNLKKHHEQWQGETKPKPLNRMVEET